ncbi:MAG TPA: N-acetylmuramoyl-L-alanine amidase [Phycisphaerae bacterium]|nr:N-acetylmuramoyl-L-alanine amidase [Phycisphaerae bacterium]
MKKLATEEVSLARRLMPYGTHAAAALGGAAAVLVVLALSGVFKHSDPVPPLPPPPDPVTTPPAAYDWTAHPDPEFPLPPYACYLQDVLIVLDPGHGGRSDRPNWKRGPTGLEEAVVNLRVAQFLREFLTEVGAQVVMTREDDVYLDPDIAVDNRKRIELANRLKADLFVSIHHNGDDAPDANYTTVFYHGGPDDSPASRCAARFLLSGINDALRLTQHLPCAMLSDRALFKTGLLVLREARVPAVLVEASFHSNPEEEDRLRDPLYNRREAYGYFLGLARWAHAGLPRVHLVDPPPGKPCTGKAVTLKLDDGLSGRGGWGHDAVKIALDSLRVRVNQTLVTCRPDLKKGTLQVPLPRKLKAGPLRVAVDFENVFGQHVLHPELVLEYAGR